MSKINNSYESSNSSMSSGGSESLAPLDKTLENIESGTITVNQLMIPIETDSQDDEENEIVPSSASPFDQNNAKLIPFKGLQRSPLSSQDSAISDQDGKFREYLKQSEVCKDAVLEDTVFESTNCDKSSSRLCEEDLSFKGKITEISFTGEKSPDDLFEDFEENNTEISQNDETVASNLSNSTSMLNDSKLLKRIQRSLSGLVPPPSITSQHLSIATILEKYKANVDLNSSVELSNVPSENSIFKSDLSTEETSRTKWPESHRVSGLGIHYNRSSHSERIELLSLDIIKRFIGSETTSSYSVHVKSPKSTKKRIIKLSKTSVQSPERRLSHLARRRAVFSSANLKATTSTNRQLILNPKRNDQKRLIIGKSKVKTPKRGRTPRRKTPRSSKKKREIVVVKPTLTRENSKRALFQSPPVTIDPPKPVVSEDVAKRVEKSKRVLFSPPKKLDRSTSFTDNPIDRHAFTALRYRSMNSLDEIGQKRRRTDDTIAQNLSKLRKLDETSSSLMIQKSQSFYMLNSQASSRTESFFRTKTDIVESGFQKVLSEHHKKKLLWAVATALKHKNITTAHPEYRKHAANLFRVVKTIFLTIDDPALSNISSTSERMMRIANNHVFDVVKGTPYDQVVQKERERIESVRNLKKIDGYIGLEEYQAHKNRRSSIFTTDSSIDGFSQCSSQAEWVLQNRDETQQEKLPLSGSSKKNNDGMALKENLDTQYRQQRSAQKNIIFSGKDQKNLDVHVKGTVDSVGNSVLKAKRQISFDN